MTSKVEIQAQELLLIANQLIQEHPSFVIGMRAHSVEEKDQLLIFKGEYFLDEIGLPTSRTTQAFNVFKYLAQTLSPQFTLKP